MSVGVAEFSRGIPEAYGDGEDIALTPPLSAIPRRSPEGANRAGSGRRRLPDRRIGNLVAPSRHPGVTHAALHDPVQIASPAYGVAYARTAGRADRSPNFPT